MYQHFNPVSVSVESQRRPTIPRCNEDPGGYTGYYGNTTGTGEDVTVLECYILKF